MNHAPALTKYGRNTIDLGDIYNELDCICDVLTLLSNVAGSDYREGVGTPAPDTLQDAIYSVVMHLERVRDTVAEMDAENHKKEA